MVRNNNMALQTGYTVTSPNSTTNRVVHNDVGRERRTTMQHDKGVSNHTTRERHLRESMKAYSDRMTQISQSRGLFFTQPLNSPEEVDDSLFVRAKHIPKYRPLPKLRDKHRLDLLDDHLSRSYETFNNDITKVKKEIYTRHSLPDLKLEPVLPQASTKKKFKMNFVSAADLYDIIDKQAVHNGAMLTTTKALALTPLETRGTHVRKNDAELCVTSNIINKTNRDKNKEIEGSADRTKRSKEIKRQKQNKNTQHDNQQPSTVSLIEKEEYRWTNESIIQTGQVQSPKTSDAMKSSKQMLTNSSEQQKITDAVKRAKFSVTEFDKQLRQAIGKSKKAKRMKLQPPNLGAIPENDIVSEESESDDNEQDAVASSVVTRKVPSRKHNPSISPLSLRPMLAAIPEITSPEEEIKDPKGLAAIKVLRSSISKDSRYHKDNVMTTHQMDAKKILPERTASDVAKGKARRQLRMERNKYRASAHIKGYSSK